MEIINVFQAIDKMREITKKDKTFSFTHSTFNAGSGTSDGVKVVRNATLRKRLPSDKFKKTDPDMLLPYIDQDTGEYRMCYKCLILQFNGIQTTLR